MWNLSLYFNKFLLLKYFLIYNLNLFDFFFSFSEINGFLHYFLHNFKLSMLYLNRFLYLNYLLILYNYFFVIDNFNKFLFVQRNYFLNLNFRQNFVCYNFLNNKITNCWYLYNFLSFNVHFNILLNYIVYWFLNINWNLFNDLNSFLYKILCHDRFLSSYGYTFLKSSVHINRSLNYFFYLYYLRKRSIKF